MATPKKPLVPAPKKPLAPVVPPKPKAKAPAPPATRFDDPYGKKPNPSGLYNRDGYMDQVPGKATRFTPAPASTKRSASDIAAAKRSGYAR